MPEVVFDEISAGNVCYSDGTNCTGGSGSVSWQSKTRINDTVGITTTWVTDDQLKANVVAGKNYTFEFWIHKDGGSTNDDAFFNVSRPDGFITASIHPDGVFASFCEDFGFVGEDCDNTPWQVTTSDQLYLIEGSYFAYESGVFALSYAENNDVGTDFTIEKGSKLTIREVTT